MKTNTPMLQTRALEPTEVDMTAEAPPRIETIFAREMSRAVAMEIGELLVRVWPKPGMTAQQRADRVQGDWGTRSAEDMFAKCSLIAREGKRMIAHACTFPRTIVGPQGEMKILALSLVCTDPEFRGRNVGYALVREAFRPVDEGVYPFSLFQTSQRASRFYHRLGCVLVENRIIDSTADQPTQCPFKDDHVVRYPGDRAGWPEGQIDLCGPGY